MHFLLNVCETCPILFEMIDHVEVRGRYYLNIKIRLALLLRGKILYITYILKFQINKSSDFLNAPFGEFIILIKLESYYSTIKVNDRHQYNWTVPSHICSKAD